MVTNIQPSSDTQIPAQQTIKHSAEGSPSVLAALHHHEREITPVFNMAPEDCRQEPCNSWILRHAHTRYLPTGVGAWDASDLRQILQLQTASKPKSQGKDFTQHNLHDISQSHLTVLQAPDLRPSVSETSYYCSISPPLLPSPQMHLFRLCQTTGSKCVCSVLLCFSPKGGKINGQVGLIFKSSRRLSDALP